MSDVLFLRSDSDLGSGFLRFPDLKKRLDERLDLAKEITDLERLIRSVNDLVKDSRYSSDERNFLRRFRQRAYDRKRNIKPTQDDLEPIFEIEPVEPIKTNLTNIQEEKPEMSLQSVEITPPPPKVISSPVVPKVDFWSGVQSAFEKIDGERFVQALPSVLGLLIPTLSVIGFLWFQSVELYKSSGFSNPEFAAAGGLLMIVGFAAYYSIRRTKLALLLCLYAGTYEVYFMASGTVQDEKVVASSKLMEDPELILLKEKAEKTHEAYQALKARYEDVGSSVHNNSWFKTKHLDPAWEKNEQAQKDFITKRNQLGGKESSAHVTWLKIFYRLGLVFLCMVLVHAFVRRFKEV